MRRNAVIFITVAALAIAGWYLLVPGGSSANIRARLQALSDMINSSTVDGVGPEARASQLGAFFTDDVDVDLGGGAAPIRGRETLVGMAGRLQPRTAAFRLQFEDVTIAMAPGDAAADVHLTAEIIRRSITSGDESLDAREFTLGMRLVNGEWQIARVTAVDTLK